MRSLMATLFLAGLLGAGSQPAEVRVPRGFVAGGYPVNILPADREPSPSVITETTQWLRGTERLAIEVSDEAMRLDAYPSYLIEAITSQRTTTSIDGVRKDAMCGAPAWIVDYRMTDGKTPMLVHNSYANIHDVAYAISYVRPANRGPAADVLAFFKSFCGSPLPGQTASP
jgi:hypothetical protein